MARPHPDPTRGATPGVGLPPTVLVAGTTGAELGLVRRWAQSRWGTAPVVSAADAAEVATLSRTAQPDLVLVDLALPRSDPLAVVRRLRAEHPESRIVVVAPPGFDEAAPAALAAGADAFVESAAPGYEDLTDVLDDLCGQAWPPRPADQDPRRPTAGPPHGEGLNQTGALDVLREGVLVVDGHGRIVSANQAAAAVLGRSAEDLVGTPTRALFRGALHSDGRPVPYGWEDPVRVAVTTGATISDLVLGLVRPDGRPTWREVNVRPLDAVRDGSVPGGAVVCLRDPADPPGLRTQLLEAEARLGRVLERVGEPLVVLTGERDAAGKVTALRVAARTEAAGRLLGWSVGDRVTGPGRHEGGNRAGASGGSGLFQQLAGMLDQPVGTEVAAPHGALASRASGNLRVVTVSADHVLVSIDEPEVADLLEAALDTGPVGIALLDSTGRAVVLNAVANRLLSGWPLVGGAPGSIPVVRWAESGRQVTPAELDPRRLLQGEVLRGLELVTSDSRGRETFLTLSGSPVQDAWGRVTGAVVTVLDNTARHLAEAALASTHEELERSNTDLREFAAVASHDLAQPLQVVAGFAELLAERRSLQGDEDGADLVDRIRGGVSRMQALIDDLLVYSQVVTPTSEAFVQVELDQVVREVIELYAEQIRDSHAEIEAAPLPAVRADRSQMFQLIQNLVGNALKYVAPGTRPHLEIAAQPERPTGPDGSVERGAATRWELSVSDNGIGIDPDQRAAAFTMFQRLVDRADYEGTGVGLAVCRRIVERHGGRIWIEDAPGGGTRVCCTLPPADIPPYDDQSSATTPE